MENSLADKLRESTNKAVDKGTSQALLNFKLRLMRVAESGVNRFIFEKSNYGKAIDWLVIERSFKADGLKITGAPNGIDMIVSW